MLLGACCPQILEKCLKVHEPLNDRMDSGRPAAAESCVPNFCHSYVSAPVNAARHAHLAMQQNLLLESDSFAGNPPCKTVRSKSAINPKAASHKKLTLAAHSLDPPEWGGREHLSRMHQEPSLVFWSVRLITSPERAAASFV